MVVDIHVGLRRICSEAEEYKLVDAHRLREVSLCQTGVPNSFVFQGWSSREGTCSGPWSRAVGLQSMGQISRAEVMSPAQVRGQAHVACA